MSNRQYSWDVKSLEILSAIERIVSGRKRRKSQPSTAPVAIGDEESSKLDIGPTTSATSSKCWIVDRLSYVHYHC